MKKNNNYPKWRTVSTPSTGRVAKKIDEQIEWYDQNSTRKDDDYIKAHLKLIKDLAENIENSEDIMFIEKIVGTFCDIIETQRSVIVDIEAEAEYLSICSGKNNPPSAYTIPDDGFTNDAQLQTAFTAYVTSQGKSSYTVNDYCSRIKKLWKSFYEEYKDGNLPQELTVDEDYINSANPMINAYNYTEALSCYINMTMTKTTEKRNWANIQAAFRKFEEFRNKSIQ